MQFNGKSPEDVTRWLEPHVGSFLDACVRRVAALDKDDAAYARVLTNPTLPKRLQAQGVGRSDYDGYNITIGVAALLRALGSPIAL